MGDVQRMSDKVIVSYLAAVLSAQVMEPAQGVSAQTFIEDMNASDCLRAIEMVQHLNALVLARWLRLDQIERRAAWPGGEHLNRSHRAEPGIT